MLASFLLKIVSQIPQIIADKILLITQNQRVSAKSAGKLKPSIKVFWFLNQNIKLCNKSMKPDRQGAKVYYQTINVK
jgi:hypothetical protein